jgi:hypothetical protein
VKAVESAGRLRGARWASRVSWEDRKIFLGIWREKIKASPEWNGEAAINRAYE